MEGGFRALHAFPAGRFELLKACGGRVDAIADIMNEESTMAWFVQATRVDVNNLLTSLGNDAIGWRTALGLERWACKHGMRSKFDVYHYTVLIGIAARAGETVRAMELFAAVLAAEAVGRSKGPTPRTWTVYIQALGGGGNWQRALAGLTAMASSCHGENKFAYAAAMKACAMAGRCEEAQAIFDSILDRGHSIDVVMATSLIEAYGRCQRFEDVHSVMGLMRRRGIKPNVVTFTVLIQSYGTAKQWRSALYAFEEIRQAGIRPNQHAISAIVTALARSDQHRIAVNLYMDMRDNRIEMNAITYGAVMACLIELREYEKCDELLAQMEAEGNKVNAVHFNMAMSAACQQNRPEKAVEIFRRLKSKGDTISPTRTSYETLARALSLAGRPEDVRRVKEELKNTFEVSPTCYIYVSLVRAYEKLGDVRSILRIVGEMREDGVQPNVHVMNAMLEACYNLKQLDAALRVYKRMLLLRVQPDEKTMCILKAVGSEGVDQINQVQTASTIASALMTATAYASVIRFGWL